MKIKFWTFIALLVLSIAGSAKTGDRNSQSESVVTYQYALYLLPGAERDPRKAATELIRSQFQQFTIVEFDEEPGDRPVDPGVPGEVNPGKIDGFRVAGMLKSAVFGIATRLLGQEVRQELRHR